jgi:coiled-coil domain-containing protein 6
MADSASESDSSSIDGGPIMMPPSPVTREQLQKRIESLQQQNRVLKVELETYKLRVKALQEENRGLRQASVFIVSYKNVGLTRERTVGVDFYRRRGEVIY